MNDILSLAVTLLITGFVVVFLVLILLIGIIKLYSTIVYNAQTKSAQKKAAMAEAARLEKEAPIVKKEVPLNQAPAGDGTISLETVAVIAAAVEAMYGKGQAKIKSVKKRSQTRPVWSTAGLMDNTRPF